LRITARGRLIGLSLLVLRVSALGRTYLSH
jgi:hypothetical protein